MDAEGTVVLAGMRGQLRSALEQRTSRPVTQEQFEQVWIRAVEICTFVARQIMERDPQELVESGGVIDPSEQWILEAVLL